MKVQSPPKVRSATRTDWHGLIGCVLAALAFVALTTGPARARDEPLAPGVMLLVSSSATMSFAPGANAAPVCAFEGTEERPEGFEFSKDRMMMLKAFLAGEPRDMEWCVEDNRDDHEVGTDWPKPHQRARCCLEYQGAVCLRWEFCWHDDGRRPEDGDQGRPVPRGPLPDFGPGAIDAYAEGIKFGLMVGDQHPARRGPDDTWSYGEDQEVPESIAAAVPEALQPPQFAGGLAKDIDRPNLGGRASNARIGAMIGPNVGRIGPDNRDRTAPIGEDGPVIRAHNERVKQTIRELVPYGGAPVAAMLADAVTYYEDGGLNSQDEQCVQRPHVVVLVLDDIPTQYYGGQDCNDDVECGAGLCVQRWIEGENRLVCEYPEGYPYDQSVSYAQVLHSSDINVFVIGLALEESDDEGSAFRFAEDIAAAGSPDLGIGGKDGFFNVGSREDLERAFARIRNSTRGGRQSRVRPLVINPTAADLHALGIQPANDGDEAAYVGPRQWRLAAYSETTGSGDSFSYGVIQLDQLECDGQGELASAKIINFANALNSPETSRNNRFAYSMDPQTDEILLVRGGGGSAFGPDGAPTGAALDNDSLQRLLRVGEHDDSDAVAGNVNPVNDDPNAANNGLVDNTPEGQANRVGDLLGGYFGKHSNQDDGERALGSIEHGDPVALQAPVLGLQIRNYEEFAADRKNRPTIIAAGANDGMLHFFRAIDGYELLTFVPELAWRNLKRADIAPPVDGPISVRDVAACRKTSGPGAANCPSDPAAVTFRTVLVGGIGGGGPNLFGIDVSDIGEIEPGGLFDPEGDLHGGDDGFKPWNFTDDDEPELGATVSKPAITHVRSDGKVVSAAIVGCGDDRRGDPDPDGPAVGRCVLVLNAMTGDVIQKFATANDNIFDARGDETALDAPVVGWPVAFPQTGIQAANQAYIGDKLGRMWRLDLHSDDVDDWRMDQIWPPANLNDEGLAGVIEQNDELRGRPIVGRPSVALRADGTPTIAFVTGGTPEMELPPEFEIDPVPRAMAVSISDGLNLDGERAPKVNWILKLRDGEVGSGPPVTAGGTLFFTTIAPAVDDQGEPSNCGARQGRLYGVGFVERVENAFDVNGVKGNVKEGIPIRDGEGNVDYALAIRLAPGAVAFGLAVVRAPSCRAGDPSTTDIVLNLGGDAAAGDVKAGSKVENLEGGGGNNLRTSDFDVSVFGDDSRGGSLDICLDCELNGDAAPGKKAELGPFPTVVTYWGTTFAE